MFISTAGSCMKWVRPQCPAVKGWRPGKNIQQLSDLTKVGNMHREPQRRFVSLVVDPPRCRKHSVSTGWFETSFGKDRNQEEDEAATRTGFTQFEYGLSGKWLGHNITTWRTTLPSCRRSKPSLISSSARCPLKSLSTGKRPCR